MVERDSQNCYSGQDLNEVASYIVESIWNRIRSNRFPDDKDSRIINRTPLIDALRKQAAQKDVDYLLTIADTSPGYRGGLAVSLLRSFSTQPQVSGKLIELWEKWKHFDDEEIIIRCHLFWRLLDDPDLPLAWHEMLLDFVLDTRVWNLFQEHHLAFWKMGKPPFESIFNRLINETPATKKWAYLCCRPPGNKILWLTLLDVVAKGYLITDPKSGTDGEPFARDVVTRLLEFCASAECA